jgi:hypothetical protein
MTVIILRKKVTGSQYASCSSSIHRRQKIQTRLYLPCQIPPPSTQMDNVLKADNILTPAAEAPGLGGNSLNSPPSTLNTDPASQSQADTFDTIPPTPQAQRPPTLPYQIINSLTSTIGGMANSASGMAQQQGRAAASPTSSYFPDAPNSNESSSSGELGNAGQAKINHGVENRKRGYSGSRANRSLSNASVGSGGVSLGLSLTNSTLFYDIPMVSLMVEGYLFFLHT